MMKNFVGKVNAPEFPRGLEWSNTERPVSITELRGRLIILDFWTFCCINCMHILPHLARLELKHESKLAVIGVHAAKFQAEKASENIAEAVARYRVTHPVVNDARMQIWESYAVRAWPTLIFVDPLGKVVGRHEGEFKPDAMDTLVGQMMAEYEAEDLLAEGPLPFESAIRRASYGSLYFPGKVEWSNKRLFISDSGHSRILIADEEGHVEEVIGSGERGLLDGSFSDASFDDPQGMAVDGETLFVADAGSHTIRKVDLQERKVSTIAGTGEQSLYHHSGGDALRHPLNSPYDVTFSISSRSVFIAMAGAHQLWRLDPQNGTIEPWAGTGTEAIKDGIRMDAHLAQPMGISALRGNVFFTDSETSAVRMAREGKDGHVVTLSGTGLFDFGDRDGIGKSALMQHPQGITSGGDYIFIADTYNNKIRQMSLSSLRVITLAEGFREPAGLAFAPMRLYVADTNAHTIKVLSLDSKEVTTLELSGL